MGSEPPKLLILVGPTAVGKTALTLELCREFNAEVISADSVAVYRGLDIGSAKPTAPEQAAAKHHLIDVADPDEDFSAARFAELADQAIDQITARGRRVLVAGGTGLYVKALLHGLAPAPDVDAQLRAELAGQWEQQGGPAMHQRLTDMDPEAAARIHPADRQRVLRALEFCLQTGERFSRRQAEHGFDAVRYAYKMIGLKRGREELNERISLRCRKMWEAGLVQEVGDLLASGVDPGARSLGSLNYRQALAFIQGEMDQATAIEDMIKQTKAYAKRQMTWFKKAPGIEWLPAGESRRVIDRARSWWEE
jgi:tRNA dimethylallyltransferase